MRLASKLGVLCLLALLAAPGFGGCGASDGGPTNKAAGGSAGSGASQSDANPDTSSGGSGGNPFEGGLDATPLDDSGLSEASACSTTSAEAALVPVNVYLVVDISGSMLGANLAAVKTGLITFFQDAHSAGLRVALNYFPKGSSCVPADYYTPEVGLGELTADSAPKDAQEYLLVNSISSKSATGGTPIYGALRGGLDFGKDHLATHPGEKMIVILTTDGSPGGCPEDQDLVNVIAGLAAHYWNVYGVSTYTIGLQGSQEAEVTKIAVNAGGDAFFLGGSANVPQDLIAALEAIKGSVIACEYSIPAKTDAGVVDPDKVNVELTTGSGTKKTFYKVDGPAQCVPDGWYYEFDGSGTPVSIKLCPDACADVQNDGKSKITILLGCASIPPP